ncbi:MAG: hypothetical protein IJS96_03460, partial [Schwartzia sp.]|nr:hypothetical protein [Schwartzia sp. (in: firmicutes)]
STPPFIGDREASDRDIFPKFSAPPITVNLTINGDTEPEGVRRAIVDAGREVQESFAEQMTAFWHEKERLSYG